MARRSRQEYANATGAFGVQQKQPGGSEGEVPEKACGMCKNFSESAWSSDGRGTCKVLKQGSDIFSDPPVYQLEGKNGYMVRSLADAAKCKYFEKMRFIDKDGHECSDPQFRRSQRQFQDK